MKIIINKLSVEIPDSILQNVLAYARKFDFVDTTDLKDDEVVMAVITKHLRAITLNNVIDQFEINTTDGTKTEPVDQTKLLPSGWWKPLKK